MAKAAMSYIPTGMSPVIPHLVCAGAAKAIEFYKKAFGAEELHRVPGPDGKLMHACIKIAGAPVFLVDEMPSCGAVGPSTLNGTPVTIHLFVKDADGFAARAAEAGAKITMPVADMFWGDRYGVLQDPFGHQWSVATHQLELTPEEISKAMGEAIEAHNNQDAKMGRK